ncbi:MAG TPA: HYR domain-containing protein [Thermomicrobiales bacterium]|nr:HYR domain-containing protein [Thermomicrobiales bacterium]
MSERVLRPIVAVVFVASLVVAAMSLVVARPALPVSAGSAGGSSCVVGTTIFSDDFESPVVSGTTDIRDVNGWGFVRFVRNGSAPQGAQHAELAGGSSDRTLDVTGRDGQQLTLSYTARSSEWGNQLSVYFGPWDGGTSAAVPRQGTYTTQSLKYTVPAGGTGAMIYLGGTGWYDNINVTVSGCPTVVTPSAPTLTVAEDAQAEATTEVTFSGGTGTGYVAVIPETDGPSNASSFSINSSSTGGQGLFTVGYQPRPDFSGTDSFTVVISDSGGELARIPVTVTVTPVEDAPRFTTLQPGAISKEGDEQGGAKVTFPTMAAEDPDIEGADKSVDVVCAATIGGQNATVTASTVFPVGTTTVTCTPTNVPAGGGTTPDTVTQSFDVVITDVSAPVADSLPFETSAGSPPVVTVVATGDQTPYSWPRVTATDAVDGVITLECRSDDAAERVVGSVGTTFPKGDTPVICTGADQAGNPVSTSFVVRVVDAPPVLTLPADIVREATMRGGTTVTWTASASSAVDPDGLPVDCDPDSGSVFPIGTTTVECTATSSSDQTTDGTFTVTVRDTTGPSITPVGGPLSGQTYTTATVPAAPTCQATDVASSVVSCTVTGYRATTGRHIMTFRATDTRGNVSVMTRTYTVTAATQPTATPVTPQPTTPVVTPAPTQPPTVAPPRPTRTPTAVPTRPGRTPVATPAPTQPPTTSPTRPPRQ